MKITKRPFNEDVRDPLVEDAIRKRYQPPARYRISRYTYAPGTRFEDAMRAGTCYVLHGTCRYDSVEVHAGEEADLEEGVHLFEAIGDDDVTMLLVWELPSELFEA